MARTRTPSQPLPSTPTVGGWADDLGSLPSAHVPPSHSLPAGPLPTLVSIAEFDRELRSAAAALEREQTLTEELDEQVRAQQAALVTERGLRARLQVSSSSSSPPHPPEAEHDDCVAECARLSRRVSELERAVSSERQRGTGHAASLAAALQDQLDSALLRLDQLQVLLEQQQAQCDEQRAERERLERGREDLEVQLEQAQRLLFTLRPAQQRLEEVEMRLAEEREANEALRRLLEAERLDADAREAKGREEVQRLEEEKRRFKEGAEIAEEEAQRAKEEAQRAKEEALRAKEEVQRAQAVRLSPPSALLLTPSSPSPTPTSLPPPDELLREVQLLRLQVAQLRLEKQETRPQSGAEALWRLEATAEVLARDKADLEARSAAQAALVEKLLAEREESLELHNALVVVRREVAALVKDKEALHKELWSKTLALEEAQAQGGAAELKARLAHAERTIAQLQTVIAGPPPSYPALPLYSSPSSLIQRCGPTTQVLPPPPQLDQGLRRGHQGRVSGAGPGPSWAGNTRDPFWADPPSRCACTSALTPWVPACQASCPLCFVGL